MFAFRFHTQINILYRFSNVFFFCNHTFFYAKKNKNPSSKSRYRFEIFQVRENIIVPSSNAQHSFFVCVNKNEMVLRMNFNRIKNFITKYGQ
jgi:hypothetical protein